MPERARVRLPFPVACLLVASILAASLFGALKSTEKFTLQELENAPGLTSRQFANLFEHFTFTFRPYVQDPEVFLAEQDGDCDDYAILADHVLRRHGLSTRIIQVRLVGTNVDHAVCYVTQDKAYLDYNNRKYSFNLQRSKPLIRDIAEKVADSLERNWASAFEFTFNYEDRRKQRVFVVVKTDEPKLDPDRR